MDASDKNYEKAASVAAYFASAYQGRTQWWAWILGFIFIIVLTFIGMIIVGMGHGIIDGVRGASNPTLSDAPSASFYISLLMSFLPIFISILVVYKYFHKLPIKSLMTSARHFRWGYLWRTVLIIFIFYSVVSLAEYWLFPSEYEGLQFQTDMSVYLKFLLITLLLVPFQAASEEFLCRGYLNQALIKYLRSPWVVFAITSGGFALLHAWNPESAGQMGPYLSSIFLFGMAMCVLLYFEGGIESAIGAHIANNIFVFGLLGYEDPDLPNTALFTLGEPVIGWTDFAIECVFMIPLIALIIWANRKWGKAA